MPPTNRSASLTGSARLDVLADRRSAHISTDPNDARELFGCELNAISTDALFAGYRETGFMYAEKLARLTPVMGAIRRTWSQALSGGSDLIRVLTFEADHPHRWATVSSWRSGTRSWTTQHLAATGDPLATRAVMLADGLWAARDRATNRARQIWFRRSNRLANKVFGSIDRTLGADAWVGDYAYFDFGRTFVSRDRACAVAPSAAAVRQFASETRSSVFVCAEELDDRDLTLGGLDDRYRVVGLRRYRRVFGVEEFGRLVGLALAYRGPLGLNLSFLENRCDLLLHQDIDAATRRRVIAGLLHAAMPVYVDLELASVPVTIDRRYSEDLRDLGGRHVRDYAQAISLDDERFFRHVNSFYKRVLLRHGTKGPEAHVGEDAPGA